MNAGQFVFLGLAAFVVAWAVGVHNQLAALRQQVMGAFGRIDAMLNRRFELVPSLVDVAKRHIAHDRETLEGVLVARNQAFHAARAARQSPGDRNLMLSLMGADRSLSAALARLMSAADAHPALRNDLVLERLRDELANIEQRLDVARQVYNDAVTLYNVAITQFPARLLALVFRFSPSQRLETPHGAGDPRPLRIPS